MKSTHQGAGTPSELKQLLRLRQLRMDAAQALVRAQRIECEQAEAAIEARQRCIDDDRQQVEQHVAYIVGAGASELPRFAHYYSSLRSALNDKLERNEYGLMDDQEVLEQRQLALLDLRQAWMREQSRHHGIEDTLQRSRKALALAREIQSDEELDELRPSGPLTPAPSTPCAAS